MLFISGTNILKRGKEYMFFGNQNELEMCKKLEEHMNNIKNRLDLFKDKLKDMLRIFLALVEQSEKKRKTISGKLRREEKLVVILRPCPYL